MKKSLTLLLVFASLNSFAQQTSILFLGNSYTYTSDLPGTLYNLALAGGDTIYHDQNTPGGYTFNQHSTNATSLSKIASRNWDYVVLQEQSQIPSFPPSQVASDCFPFAQVLVDSIKSNYACTEPVFFMTWGRRDGDQSNCANYPPLCTFEGMNARLRQSYLQMGSDNDATVAPCGAAWQQMKLTNSTFWNGLYSNDGSHPSAWGTYLNACIFYATIFRESPVGIPYYSSIGQTDAETLQQLAQDVVLDSLSNWYIGHQDVVSNATDTMVGSFTFDFYGLNENATDHFWDFGDGSTSTQENPTHEYPNDDVTYEVMHVAYSDCGSDTSYLQVSTTHLGVAETSRLQEIQILQTGNWIEIRNVLNDDLQLTVVDYAGRSICSKSLAGSSTTVVDLPVATSIYLVRISSGEEQLTRKIMTR
ncbi:MAG: T9SS type A sorting domain-containing protein [Flavobacteriales bacterium]|nr:T9SS type A sorting domain-containing protein [Flavobacteriales bacterium]